MGFGFRQTSQTSINVYTLQTSPLFQNTCGVCSRQYDISSSVTLYNYMHKHKFKFMDDQCNQPQYYLQYWILLDIIYTRQHTKYHNTQYTIHNAPRCKMQARCMWRVYSLSNCETLYSYITNYNHFKVTTVLCYAIVLYHCNAQFSKHAEFFQPYKRVLFTGIPWIKLFLHHPATMTPCKLAEAKQ